MSVKRVDRERKTDLVLHHKEDKQGYNLIYYGLTESFTAADDEPVWQIKRVTLVGTVKTTLYAVYGRYQAKWSDRGSYFPAGPVPIPDPVPVYTASGLQNGGLVTRVQIDENAWTELPATPLLNRNAMAVQNTSGVEIKLNYDSFGPLPAGYEGVVIPVSDERFYGITDEIKLYARSAPGSGQPWIQVEEIS